MANPTTDTRGQAEPNDRFLARRFNFLGLPSEKRGGISYAAVRAELGDENAAALVTRIGELVQKHGLDRLGISLHDAVDRIVQTLTPDERRAVASGGSVQRVEALIDAEAKQAEIKQKTNGTKLDNQQSAANGAYGMLAQGDKINKAANMRDDRAGGGKGASSYDRQILEQSTRAAALADHLNLGWAKNNPELLRLGPSAIQALADAHFREESYKRLTREALFSAKDVVTVATFAKKTRQDANDLANTIVDSNKALATGVDGKVDQRLLRELRDAETSYMADPNNQEKKNKLNETVKRAAGNDEAKKTKGEELIGKLGAQKKAEAMADKNTDAKVATSKSALDDVFSAEPDKPSASATKAADAATKPSKTLAEKPREKTTQIASAPKPKAATPN